MIATSFMVMTSSSGRLKMYLEYSEPPEVFLLLSGSRSNKQLWSQLCQLFSVGTVNYFHGERPLEIVFGMCNLILSS